MTTRLQFLITADEYRANIQRQKVYARIIWWKERLEEPLEKWERDFLRYQRSRPIPNEAGRRGRPLSGRGLSDAEYALLRTSRLLEGVDYLNPGGEGAPRKHDNASISYQVACLLDRNGRGVRRVQIVVAEMFGITLDQVKSAWRKHGDAALDLCGIDPATSGRMKAATAAEDAAEAADAAAAFATLRQ